MHIYGIHSSSSESCGISIFNKHLEQTFYSIGIDFESLNIYKTLNYLEDNSFVILHYIPSAFTTIQSSKNLMKLLEDIDFEKLLVIFHGVYVENEKRYLKDTLCPYQKEHLELIFKKSIGIIALSISVKINLKKWFTKFKIDKKILVLDHPGLFISKPSFKINSPYIFFGGVLRPKKNCNNAKTDKLLKMCKENRLLVWMHWSNVNNFNYSKINSYYTWKITNGLLSDQSWCNIISNAKIVLCPYETQIQSVSGLIAEALSAQCFVLTTEFDFAIEMQKRFPQLVFVNNDLEQWPSIIESLLNEKQRPYFNYYNWNEFVNDLLSIFVYPPEYVPL